MQRTFASASSEYLGFTPQTFDTWEGTHVYALGRRTSSGVANTIYYAGSGAGNGNLQLGVSTLNDLHMGTNAAASVSFAGTIGSGGTGTNANYMGASKAAGTATPRADYVITPFAVSWVHSNMSGTVAAPATTAATVEYVGRYSAGSEYWNGDFVWVGVWGQGTQLSAGESEGLVRIAPRFLPGFLHGCQRFWWFSGYITDTVRDLSNHGADQNARTGTTQNTYNVALPGLYGTTFNLVPGVL